MMINCKWLCAQVAQVNVIFKKHTRVNSILFQTNINRPNAHESHFVCKIKPVQGH